MAVDVVGSGSESFVSKLGFPDRVDQLMILAVTTLVIWILESTFEYLYKVRWRGLAQTVQHELRLDAYGHVQRLDMAFFEDRSNGGLA